MGIEQNIKKCMANPDVQYNFIIDSIFIQLYWIGYGKEKNRLELISKFINLYYVYALGKDEPDTRTKILEIQQAMEEDWSDIIKYLYKKYFSKWPGRNYVLNELCHTIEIFLENISKDNSKPFHNQAV